MGSPPYPRRQHVHYARAFSWITPDTNGGFRPPNTIPVLSRFMGTTFPESSTSSFRHRAHPY
jgi:hypothetical protein